MEGIDDVRKPAVADRFYPGDPQTLKAQVKEFLRDAKQTRVKGTVRALVSPHAGYVYSGIVAGAAYNTIPPATRKVIIIGSSHRMRYSGASIPNVSAYQTPLGRVPVAPEAKALLRQPGFSSISHAHEGEHSIEVQLPFLQVVLGNFEFIPILLGQRVNPDDLADILLPLVRQGFFIIASTDLSHYYPYEKARNLDATCCQAVPSLDFQAMKNCQACAWVPTVTVMKVAEKLGWTGTLLDYRNSGDTTGAKDKVVGYAAIAFTDIKGEYAMPSHTSPQDKTDLLQLARSVMASRLTDTKIQRPEAPSPLLMEKRGCFVTIHKNGQLRGCIGTIEPIQSLMEGVESNAYNAAFRDPRFSPLTAQELDDIEVEVSVLTVPEEIQFTDGKDLLTKIKPGVHGVILSKGRNRSTFLPQVWEQLSNPQNFLTQLCKKGGMSPGCWQDPGVKVEVYEAEYFSEHSE
ncbi:MAG: AmmeMemoRadiSam system protein B [Desulfatibacillum sp.]|nr:AmmeMemoRadiSam system protein B [Desulfatibacillum sp.]